MLKLNTPFSFFFFYKVVFPTSNFWVFLQFFSKIMLLCAVCSLLLFEFLASMFQIYHVKIFSLVESISNSGISTASDGICSIVVTGVPATFYRSKFVSFCIKDGRILPRFCAVACFGPGNGAWSKPFGPQVRLHVGRSFLRLGWPLSIFFHFFLGYYTIF